MKQQLLREARRIAAQARRSLLALRLGNRWEQDPDEFGRRRYSSYQEYVSHQRTKFDGLRAKSIRGHDRRFYHALAERLGSSGIPLTGAAVLCLAARQGTEVRAFIAQGAFAIGIDLNPGPDNRYVLPGDFHDLQFGAGSVDIVYTNSIDHAFDPERLLAEVRRVLCPAGLFIAEVRPGAPDGSEGRGFYESFSWAGLAPLTTLVERAGFRLETSTPFQLPWPGQQLRFRRA